MPRAAVPLLPRGGMPDEAWSETFLSLRCRPTPAWSRPGGVRGPGLAWIGPWQSSRTGAAAEATGMPSGGSLAAGDSDPRPDRFELVPRFEIDFRAQSGARHRLPLRRRPPRRCRRPPGARAAAARRDTTNGITVSGQPGHRPRVDLLTTINVPTSSSVTSPFAERRSRDLLDDRLRTVDSPLGPLLVATTSAGVVRVAFTNVKDHDAVLADCPPGSARGLPRDPATPRHRRPQLDSCFAGRRRSFDVPIDLRLARGLPS